MPYNADLRLIYNTEYKIRKLMNESMNAQTDRWMKPEYSTETNEWVYLL